MRRHFFHFLLVISAVALTACGGQNSDPIPPSDPEPEILQTPAPTPAPPAEPVTEEELRSAIAELGGTEDAAAQKQEYYERLYAMDLFGEEDYLALAEIYGGEGDWESQRLMLYKVLRLYPSREYAQMLSDIVIRSDNSDEELASLVSQITVALEQQELPALTALFHDPQWLRLFPAELTGIESKLQYTDNGGVLQITTDNLTTEMTWRTASDSLFLYRNDSSGTLLLSASLESGVYSGTFSIAYFDPSGAEVRFAQGTLSGGVCVDQLTIRYQGTEYQGTFSSAGATQEEQLKEVSQKGNVIYAYDSKKKTYLYQKGTTVSEFRIDAAFLGLPEYTEW
ncbi:MAG: hypothetical protein NC432_00970 [Roseburia sp.]|nr:hypothetical protein [Roseburia sp.]MCM1098296.1 hypothetical protein [Ruminococcus flavefaciens]